MLGSPVRRSPAALIAVNAAALAVVAAGLGFRLASGAALSGAYLASVATGVPAHVAFAVGAYRLGRSDVSPEYYPRIVRWTLVGAGLLAALVGVFAVTLHDSWVAVAGTIRWAASVGGAAGFFAGFVSARLTEQRLAAERASVRAEEAARRRESLEYLNALLRHEVLNAATVVSGRAAHLQSQSEDDDLAEHLAAIRRQADDMAATVDDVRVLIRASADSPDLEPIDAVSIVEEQLRAFDEQYDRLRTESDLPAAAVVRADELLDRLFEELFRNSVEHSDAAPVRLTVAGRTTDEHLVVEVADDGPGIPPDLREGLFAQGVDRLDEKSRLGAAIVGRLAETYGGDVELTETGPDGTVVTVRLPLATARTASDGSRSTAVDAGRE
ncbi:sensor histidine kinase [Halomicrobium salinisoli]|uniref:sensor histidine kinase n=1 Tax=Halomicrobium salinisoli TaxID=2878391 RepID=UPI001CF04EF0|nr:HAMP domain-containing sensor histidine kinase [Halomicrobium salinisoli]